MPGERGKRIHARQSNRLPSPNPNPLSDVDVHEWRLDDLAFDLTATHIDDDARAVRDLGRGVQQGQGDSGLQGR
ncbi:hypothetical protein I541_0478 [Mycobacteroides abscessus]|uniref:Uncharacterized protein n=1 Tax=Mycobacteroides abscessus 21 TaxID=1299324 RepID=A0A829Q2J8_9MYCO|nr:hypothetical protein I543_2051 [Mycobacteroides abscessus 21]EUA83694.1 hypothetical protein I541_0478 [Mycobacteroides abscessus]